MMYSPEPPHAPDNRPMKSDDAWKSGWKAGWAKGAQDEADARKINHPKLKEMSEYIAAIDSQAWRRLDEDVMESVRVVFFPNLWERIKWRLFRAR